MFYSFPHYVPISVSPAGKVGPSKENSLYESCPFSESKDSFPLKQLTLSLSLLPCVQQPNVLILPASDPLDSVADFLTVYLVPMVTHGFSGVAQGSLNGLTGKACNVQCVLPSTVASEPILFIRPHLTPQVPLLQGGGTPRFIWDEWQALLFFVASFSWTMWAVWACHMVSTATWSPHSLLLWP